mmetsp:Transcript_56896/g.114077  ORF Transcript_56896/g.114077 Transcript_56896/m.114077 type:complete len:96 (-) Transcript_56896:28-315(-)
MEDFKGCSMTLDTTPALKIRAKAASGFLPGCVGEYIALTGDSFSFLGLTNAKPATVSSKVGCRRGPVLKVILPVNLFDCFFQLQIARLWFKWKPL